MGKKILVTSALPYANGSIHLGHILEGIQTDIFVRFQKAVGNQCYFFCADDTHGTPIMIAAKKKGISPEELISEVHKEHYKDLSGFHIGYDLFYTTNSNENLDYSQTIYNSLKAKGHIAERNIEQSYCDHDQMFLPDRYIKGTCPKCNAKDQYGDSCEVCGSSYSPKDLKDSACTICNNKPTLKTSKHLFFKLEDFRDPLLNWIQTSNHLTEGVQKKLLEWFDSGLQEWDISRDGPYFGFEIPGEVNKYFYVWLDAPIGYMAASQKFFENNQSEFDAFWKTGEGEIHHFIGKDILYFHGLFWPAMLTGAGFQTPTRLNVHGFMTVGGEKMSKSRGTFINASTYLKYLDPEHFRFYMAARLSPGMEDIDISFDDFVSRVNSDLIGNLVNIVSRVSTSILDKLNRKLGKMDTEGLELLTELRSKEAEITNAYLDRNTTKVIREITALGDKVNKYINDQAPWILIKTDPEKTRVVVTNALQSAMILFAYLEPVLPQISQKLFLMLGVDPTNGFAKIHQSIESKEISPYSMLSTRIDEKKITAMQEETKQEFLQSNPQATTPNTASTATAPTTVSADGTIGIEDLAKVELRVGLILSANAVEGADKLLQVQVDLGEKGTKNVFAGIKSAYSPEELVGLKVVVVANLKPRQMKFGLSEAMLLASGKEKTLSLFVPHRNAEPGDLLK